MPREIVNEASNFTLRAKFFGTGSAAATPSTVRYRIRDLSNDRIVRDWTTLTPAAVIDIDVAASDNEIYRDNDARRFEERVLVIQANYDEETQYADEFRYVVRNLHGFES